MSVSSGKEQQWSSLRSLLMSQPDMPAAKTIMVSEIMEDFTQTTTGTGFGGLGAALEAFGGLGVALEALGRERDGRVSRESLKRGRGRQGLVQDGSSQVRLALPKCDRLCAVGDPFSDAYGGARGAKIAQRSGGGPLLP